ncbi:hypothetical protein HMPREF0072_1093 [Anaerococcus lactolyticus ATCC 51172]|uniref:Uncharacterized protein n=1 Tax=Anaerococcus lactolyticus ATCC 51172 TaxID=525254 RepID=C2BFH3_9FIRM|nr:hypothetical protein [Anaerococcus lactolyticus]EEI86377.1 hypothetical protein HMPREF0072_1093 [Anaerococcus lactolyticus ATCC 51172]
MFDYKENDFSSFKMLFTQLGCAVGAYSSLVLKDKIILVFLACLGAGFLLGTYLDKKKVC